MQYIIRLDNEYTIFTPTQETVCLGEGKDTESYVILWQNMFQSSKFQCFTINFEMNYSMAIGENNITQLWIVTTFSIELKNVWSHAFNLPIYLHDVVFN